MRWHRAGFRHYWRWKSRSLGGRPQIEAKLRALIQQMSIVCTENLNPGIVVMQSAEDGERFDVSGPLNRARNRRIFVQ